ncbi:MAG: ferrous iron transport protein B [Prevotella sp.]|nr:ferrous iron transport protein B [Prevotella sp.]
MKLSDIKIGESARVTAVGGSGALRQHILDMGLIPGAVVRLEKFAPMGDPMQLVLHGYTLTLRRADAESITVEPLQVGGDVSHVALSEEKAQSQAGNEASRRDILPLHHPGLGEGGKYHDPKHEHPLPEGTVLSFALVGNQNCGKTTLFNQLTGANQHVGNFPGVTVDRKTGTIRGHLNSEVTDLPGIYSLSPYTSEEVVSRNFLNQSHPHGIINIVDSTNMERNLYLTMQLMELNVPMVLALNMMDELTGNGGTVKVNEMEQLLGMPVVPISASRNEGVEELIEHALHVAKYQETPVRQDFCLPDENGGAVHRCLHAIMHFIEDHAQRANIPLRFAATKLVEGDRLVEEKLQLTENERESIEHIVRQMEEERGLDRAAAIADMRYAFINRLCERTVVRPHVSKESLRSERIDKVLTGRWTALPVFIAVMAMIFWLTFDILGGTMQGWLEDAIAWFTDLSDSAMRSWDVNDTVRSLIIDGVYAGCGTVASFVPIIVILFFFLSMMEDSGYMARIAFVMDKLLRRLGLSGRSIVPLLMGFGCSVPAIMSSRTLPSERDRRLTIMLTPFMSCTAKLPIYAFFCAAFFPGQAAWVMSGLYLLGILTGIIVALCLKRTAFKGEPVPFVMELPNYRMPGMKTTMLLLWEKTSDFLQRAFTVIFLATIVIWFLQTFSFRLDMVDDSAQSILGQVASVVAPVFRPLGFDDWRLATSLVGGFLAKESVVSTITVLFGEGVVMTQILSIPSVISFLVFCLLYTPCVAAIATVKRELGGRDAVAVVVAQCIIAYIVAFIVYNIALL